MAAKDARLVPNLVCPTVGSMAAISSECLGKATTVKFGQVAEADSCPVSEPCIEAQTPSFERPASRSFDKLDSDEEDGVSIANADVWVVPFCMWISLALYKSAIS